MSQPSTDDVWVYKRLLSYTPWAAFFLSLFGFAVYSVANVSVVQLVAYLVDSLQGSSQPQIAWLSDFLRAHLGINSINNQWFVPLAIIGIVIVRGVGTFIGNYFLQFAANSMVYQLRIELFDRFLNLPSSFFDSHPFGHLVAKLTYHVTQVTGAATDAVKILFREGLTVIGYLSFLLYLNWRLTLLFLIAAPLIGLLARLAGRRFRRISERIQNSVGDVTQVASEAVQGYREVRTFSGEDYERARFQKVSEFNRNQSMKMVMTSAIATPIIQVIVSVVLAGLVWLLLEPSIRGSMSTGDVVAFITTGGLIAKPIRQLTDIIAIVQKGIAAASDLFSIIDEETEDDNGDWSVERVAGDIEFRNVSFGYAAAEEPVLKNISFVAKAGETIALVGPSGGGKSTLAALIPRFYEPTVGEILLDGRPIQDYSRKNLRSHMAIVSQTITLFNDTIDQNIAYGRLSQKTDQEIEQAIRDAQALDFIESFDQGRMTQVGDNGVLLSGGQRQRIAIARALLKDAPVLILDEATSALDGESERAIQAALERVVQGRTTIVIAHRLSTIEKADRILVLDEGEIKEQGTHESLLALGERYAEFYRAPHTNDELPVEAVPSVTDDARPQNTARPSFSRSLLLIPALWYNRASRWMRVLSPLSWLFGRVSSFRRRRFLNDPSRYQCPIPVLVVGNITAGGTGKTPVVMSLTRSLLAQGRRPGIISRGYGGKNQSPMLVEEGSDPAIVGDEPLMMANETGVPVVCCRDRSLAAQFLVDHANCDVIISDDGLQHYQLRRDFEIAVIDGARGFGNGLLLPAGPLREPVARLSDVDAVLVNGIDRWGVAPERATSFSLIPEALIDAKTRQSISIKKIAEKRVRAVAGIGNPKRFFETLRDLGALVIEHPWPDHAPLSDDDLQFGDDVPIVITDKDFHRCKRLDFSMIKAPVYVLKVRVDLPAYLIEDIMSHVTSVLDRH